MACFDGSLHPCGFDCQAYYYRLHGGGGGNSQPVYIGPSPEQIAAQQRQNEANQLTQQGIQYFDREDWAQAANSFEAALEKDPGNATIQGYLKRAKDNMAWLDEKNKSMGEMKGMDENSSGLKGGSDDDSTGLKGQKDDDTGSGGLKDSLKDEEPAPPKPHPNLDLHHAKRYVAGLGDASVVDARDAEEPVPDMGPDIEHSSAVREAHKGFKCLQNQDWKSALAWFEQGLVKDPKNPALLRLVDLGKYTLQRRKELEKDKVAASEPVNADILFLFPADKKKEMPTAEDWAMADAAMDQSLSNLINNELLSLSEKRVFGFLGKGDLVQAKEELKWCIKFSPDQPRYREALKALEKNPK